MRVSYNWLKDYVDIKLGAAELAKKLTMAGLSVESVEEADGDHIMELEVTSNRPDCLSYTGVAREVAAITGVKLKIPSCVKSHASCVKQKRTTHDARRMTIKVADKRLCSRYTARVIRGVKVGESPAWLKAKIGAIGLRSVNNVVDITNFCLFETGEPMHAFDLGNLEGNTVIVRSASAGEKISVIDGTERLLDGSMLVIADAKGPVAIAGVMGGVRTEVGGSTKDILLEAAYFDPISVRRTSRKLALSSDSSYRFERKVDIDAIERASDRAAQLIKDLAGGEIREFIDIGRVKKAPNTINLDAGRLNSLLGTKIPPSKIKSILASLGLKAVSSAKNSFKFSVPSFRQDLRDEIDLIEEVARIYGYDNIPETLPAVVEKSARVPKEIEAGDKIRDILKNAGFSEIITYSLLSKKELSMANIASGDAVSIRNPLSAEQQMMRPSAIPGMLEVIAYNINRKSCDLRLFELGKVYSKEGANSFNEKRNLAVGVTGALSGGWVSGSRGANLFDLKGALEKLVSAFGLKGLEMRETSDGTFSGSARAAVEIAGTALGVIGEIAPAVAKNFDIKTKVYILELDCEELMRLSAAGKRFIEPARYPPVLRDVSLIADNGVTNLRITDAICAGAGPLLKNVELIDRYRGGQIPDGKQSLTYRLEYRANDRTLEEKEVQDVHARVLRSLKENLGVTLR